MQGYLRRISEQADLFVLGVLSSGDLVNEAAEALAQGYDTPAVRMLAASFDSDDWELRRLLDRALKELGTTLLSKEEAGLSIARSIAEDIVSGGVSPYAGGEKICELVYARLPYTEYFEGLRRYVDEYSDPLNNQSDVSECIAMEAEKLLRTQPDPRGRAR
jgi:hypothetical protein